MIQLDILVFAAHPDDAELGCSGTILKHSKVGLKVGIVDITKGELGTRGNIESRKKEAQKAAEVLQLNIRENIGLKDGFIGTSESECTKVIEMIRKYKPKTILCNAPEDRHPDHGAACELVIKANFLSGLQKLETKLDNIAQSPWRASNVYSYIQDRYLKPDFVIDISQYWELKKQSILAFESQFWNPNSEEPSTYISSLHFLNFVEARSREMGHSIGAEFGEGFIKHQQISKDFLV